MKKIMLVFILFFVLLGIASCGSEELYYSPILELNNAVIYQYKEYNSYLDQYPHYATFEDFSEIQYGNFTMIVIDRNLGEENIEKIKKLFLMPSEHKMICLIYDSKKIKYQSTPGYYLNYSNVSLKYGERLDYVGYGNNTPYSDPMQKYIAIYCFGCMQSGVSGYMKQQ